MDVFSPESCDYVGWLLGMMETMAAFPIATSKIVGMFTPHNNNNDTTENNLFVSI